MIPVGAAMEAIPAILALIRWIRGLLPNEEQEALKQWANLLKDGPTPGKSNDPKWQDEVNEFLVKLTLRKGYSPAYTWEETIDVPEDMLTDLVDLLVGGWSGGGKWTPSSLLRNPVKDRLDWRATMASGNDRLILGAVDEWLAKRGRSRDYSPVHTIAVNRDWLADAVSTLVG